MIRIDILSQSPEEAVMRIAGWVQYDCDIALVAQEGKRYLETSKRLVLDLEHLQRLSDRALPLLKEWKAQGRLQIRAWHYLIDFKLRHHGLIPPRKENLQ
jgi:methylase of polypeptide subunit release factors